MGRHERKRRLVRRIYRSAGPNAAWHMDGYDKLKPFGIAINGCTDGYSKKIMWLEAYTTNNNPRVILGYCLEAVRKQGGCPTEIRADMGTENRLLEHVQTLLCRSEKSFVYGKSTGNQTIEGGGRFSEGSALSIGLTSCTGFETNTTITEMTLTNNRCSVAL